MKSEVSLFKVGTIWHYRYRLDGRRIQKSTKETARSVAVLAAEGAYKAAKLRSRGLEPEPTLGALAALWVQSHVLVFSPARIKTVETIARLHIGTLKDLALQELTTQRVEEARVIYLQGHGRESANLWLQALGALVRWAIKRNMIRFVPWQVAPLKIQRKPKVLLPTGKSADWMASVEALSSTEPGISLVVRLMAGLGVRVSEALGARWEWLDFERETYTPGDTKGNDAWPRPVSPWLLATLHPHAKLMGPIVPLRPGHPITDRRVAGIINKANKACGVLHITPHRLRGTYATWLSELGVPVQDIQRALAHKDVKTTLRYLEVDLSRVSKAQISIGDRLGMTGREKGEPGEVEQPQPSPGGFYGRIHEGEGQ